MADNVDITAGSGTTVATDNISSVHHPYVKVEFGADNTATKVDASNPLPVVQTGALPAGTAAIGKLAANTGVTIGAVEVAAAQTLATVTNVATIGTSVTPGTSAAHLGKAEDAGASSGDTGVAIIAKRVDTAAAQTDTDGDYTIPVANSNGQLRVGVNRTFQTADADSLLKAEDAAHTTGDAGVMMLGVRESTATDLSAGNTNGDYEPLQVDANGALWVSQATLQAGEDLTNNRMMTLPKYSYSAVATGDVQVKGSAGVLHSVTFSCNDAAPTAGSIIIYDNTAESGTQVFNHTFTTTPFVPFTIVLDYIMATGIYIGFTTTADVNVSCAYL